MAEDKQEYQSPQVIDVSYEDQEEIFNKMLDDADTPEKRRAIMHQYAEISTKQVRKLLENSMDHYLRNPASLIVGYGELLEGTKGLDEHTLDMIKTMAKGADQLVGRIDMLIGADTKKTISRGKNPPYIDIGVEKS